MEETDQSSTLVVSMFGYELIREILLPEILGQDTPEVLYWAGKALARKFPLMSEDEISTFFNEAGWGNLQISKQQKRETSFDLSGPFIERKIKLPTTTSFSLEAGFIAEQISIQKNVTAEAIHEVQKRSSSVKIIIQWNEKD
ncbi:putative hydrocarbon binding protein [Oikeobacillus pervagus]|uniref:Hydrocarbon binding protein n=1 Tax=Oikeobacillus pervagus TaxID=1325931 RepID=A0AAJ1WGS8_9BACI|nr:YslB family protein [Oikeobacillus pervagus]MDQ0215432.1 putative hydrocarbon binding protein [Oikeobacillus pervagus]